MGSNVGALGVVGLAKEAAWGTGVAPTEFVPFSSEGFKDGPEAVSEAQMRGVLDASLKYKGMQMVTGSLAGVVYPDQLGHLLRAALGAPVTSGVGPFTHTFTPIQAAFSDDAALPPYSFTVNRGAHCLRYLGMVCSSFGLSFAQGGLLKFSSSWLGKDAESTSAPTVTLPTTTPFQLTAAITRGGVAYAEIQDISLSITNALEALKLINNSNKVGRITLNGLRAIGLTGTADFSNAALYDQFKAFTTEAWEITFTQGTSSLTITLPAALITDAGAAMGGEGRISLSFTAEGQYDTVTGKALEIVLDNDVASY